MRANCEVPRAWPMVALLCLLYAFSLLDRMMPALLLGGLQADLQISPLQFGLLIGTGFGILYSIVGIPIAHLIDRGNRKWIVFAGVALWSIATIASGMAHDYAHLATARAGIAIGEAVLMPAAISMIGDLFSPADRTRPTAIFAATGQVMGAGLFLLGAGAVLLAAHLAPALGLAEWRVAFILVGLPPAIVVLIWAIIVREPERRIEPIEGQSHESASDAIRYLGAHRRLYLYLYLSVAATSTIAFATIAWLPTVLRQSGLTPAGAGAAMGLVGIVPSLAGATVSPTLSLWLQRKGMARGPVFVGCGMLVLAVLPLCLTIGSGSATMALGGFGCATFGFAGFYLIPLLIIQWVAPSRLRARLTAINQLAVNVIGLAIGPPAVALIASHWLADDSAIGPALALLAVAAGVTAIVMLLRSSRGFAQASANTV